MLTYLMMVFYAITAIFLLFRVEKKLFYSKLVKRNKLHKFIIICFAVLCTSPSWGVFGKGLSFNAQLHKFGNLWLAFYFYFLLDLIIVEIILKIVLYILKHKGKKFKHNVLLISLSLITAVSFLAVIYGDIHANKTVVTKYNAEVEKQCTVDELNVVLISDLHIGYQVTENLISPMVTKINDLNPDVVVIAGDIFDSNFDAVQSPEKLSKIIKNINSKYGVYGIYGNHDVQENLIGGFATSGKNKAFRDERMDKFMADSGVTMLKDEVVTIGDTNINLVGRIDGEKAGDGTNNRLSVEEILNGVNCDNPCIVLEHEPNELNELAANGVDLSLCGHTHAGQFFPLNLTQNLIWKNPYGMIKIDNMYNVVSSGVGYYGPPIRVMTDSEIVEIKIKFNK